MDIHIGEYVEAGEYLEGGYYIQNGDEYKDYQSEEDMLQAAQKFKDKAQEMAKEHPGLCSSVYEDYSFSTL